MIPFLFLIAVSLAANCGVYETGCMRIQGVSFSSVADITVSCSLSGYVSGISESLRYYSSDNCGGEVFMQTGYSYSLKWVNGTSKDEGIYDMTLSKATVRSDDVATLKDRHVSCVPEMQQGKTYSWADITCKVLIVDLWSAYRENLGKAVRSVVSFNDNDEGVRRISIVSSYTTYSSVSKTSSFWGCWSWWSILLVILAVIIVIAIIVVIILAVTKKGKGGPKKSKGKK